MPVGAREDLIQGARTWINQTTGLGLEKIIVPMRTSDVPLGGPRVPIPAPTTPYAIVNIEDSGTQISTYEDQYVVSGSQRLRSFARAGTLTVIFVGENGGEYADTLAAFRDTYLTGTLTTIAGATDVAIETEDGQFQRRHQIVFNLEYMIEVSTPTTAATSFSATIDVDGQNQTIDGDLAP